MTTLSINNFITNNISPFIENIPTSFSTNVVPILQGIFTKVQTIWQNLKPFLELGAKALTTRCGTGIICITSALGFFGHAKQTQDRDTRITSAVIGTLSLLAGAYLIATH